MSKQVTVTLKSGAKVIADVTTTRLASRVNASISYRNIHVYASGQNETQAIKAAHQKFIDTVAMH